MATVDQSGIVGKIRDKPIGNALEQLLKNAAEATGIDKVYVTSGSQPGTHGLSTGSTRHNNERAADLQLISNGNVLTFSDTNGGQVAAFVTACAERGATGIGAGVHYMGNKTIHVGFGTSPQDTSKIVWGANGASANAPEWLRNAALAGWSSRVSGFFVSASTQVDGYDETVPEPDDDTNESDPSTVTTMDSKTAFPRCDGMIDISHSRISRSAKPNIEYIESPYQYSRGGVDIDHIVIHYTTSRNIEGTISHFKQNEDEIACHYIIGRDGRIVQMVKDKKKSYHGNSKNSRSIGIEHCAAPGDEMTQDQEVSSLQLIRWLCAEYDIPIGNIIAHKCAPRATKCPGDLFKKYGATGGSSCETHRQAIQEWLSEKL